jgi:hypothetical protein
MEYNPNPTVYRPTRRKTTGKEGSLWLVENPFDDSDSDSDTPEPIDAEEIFGLLCRNSCVRLLSQDALI